MPYSRLIQKVFLLTCVICNQTCWNNTEHHFVTYWATYQHAGRRFIAKKKLQQVRRWWHVLNKMLIYHFNGTIVVVLHVGLRPLCKWFSVQLTLW